MLIPPLALAVGALGLLARGHRRVVLILAFAAPILSIGAFAVQFVPGGAESCSASTGGPNVCQSLPAVSGWGGPLPYLIAIGLILLSLAPLASVRTGKWWPAAASGLLQAVPQVISFGGFVDWAPALAVTAGVAFALVGARSVPEPAPAGSLKR
jgi:hypothetical protein